MEPLRSFSWDLSTSSAVLAVGPVRLAVLRLVAAAVRLPLDVKEDDSTDSLCRQRVAAARMIIEVCTELLLRSTCTGEPEHRQPVLGFVHGLLRTQAVQAASCQLAALSQPATAAAVATEVAEATKEATAVGAAGAGSQPNGVPLQGQVIPAAATVEPPHTEDGLPGAAAGQEQPHGQPAPEPGAAAPAAVATPSGPVLHLTAKLATFVYAVVASVSSLVMYKNQDVQGCLQLCGELAKALQGGLVLEHAGRALLLALLWGAAPAESSPMTAAAAAATPAASCGLAGDCMRDTVITAGLAALGVFRLAQFCRESQGYAGYEDPCSTSISERLQSAVSGRCTRYAALSRGLALLSAADGGPVHGLPEMVCAALPLQFFRFGDGREGGRWLPIWTAHTLRSLMRVCTLGTRDPRPRQPSRRCALALAFRVGLAGRGVNSRAWERRQREQGGQGRQGQPCGRQRSRCGVGAQAVP